MTDVFSICDAYESGYGHGLKDDGLSSPYKNPSDEDEAYKIGYDLAKRRMLRSIQEEEMNQC